MTPRFDTAAWNTLALSRHYGPDPDGYRPLRGRLVDRPHARPWSLAGTDFRTGHHVVGRGRATSSRTSSPTRAVSRTPCFRFFVGHTVHIDWLAQTWTGNAVIWIVSIWKGVGWSFIMFLAALDGVPRDLVEAGPRRRRQRDASVAPRRDPQYSTDDRLRVVFLVIGASQVFTQVFILTSGGPYGSTEHAPDVRLSAGVLVLLL